MSNKPVDIQIFDRKGNIEIREVLRIVFYLQKSNEEIVQHIERAIKGFINFVSFKELPYYLDDEGRTTELNNEALQNLLYKSLFSPNRAPNAAIQLQGKEVYVPKYWLEYVGLSSEIITEWQESVSYLWCWVPKNDYMNRSTEIINYVSMLAEELPFTFGYMNLALEGKNRRIKQALGKRHLGLDITPPDYVSEDLGIQAAGSYWVTFLGTKLCSLLGGVSALRNSLPKKILVEELSDGKGKIVLGEIPERGDVNRRDLLPNYQTLANFFWDKKVLHIPKKFVYFIDNDGKGDREAMEEWHRRFLKFV